MSRLDLIEAEHGYAASHPSLPTLLASALHAEHGAIPGLLAIARAAAAMHEEPCRETSDALLDALEDFEAGR